MFAKSTIGCLIATHGVAVAGGGGICWAYRTTFKHTPNPVEFVKDNIICIVPKTNSGPSEQGETIEYYTCESIQTNLPPLEGIDHDFSHSSTEFEMNNSFRSNTAAYKDINKLTKGTIIPKTSTQEEESFYHSGDYGKNTLYFLKTTMQNNDLNTESFKKRISNFLLERIFENSLTFYSDNLSSHQPISQQTCDVYGIIESLPHIKYGICDNISPTPDTPPTHIRNFQPLTRNDQGEIIFAYGGNTEKDTKEAFMLQSSNGDPTKPFRLSYSDVYFYNAGVLKERELKQLIRRATIYLMHMYPDPHPKQHSFDPIWTEPTGTLLHIDGHKYYFVSADQYPELFQPNPDCREIYCEGIALSPMDVSMWYDQQGTPIFLTTSQNQTYITPPSNSSSEENKALAMKIKEFLNGKRSILSSFKFSFHNMTYVHFIPKTSLKTCEQQRQKYCEGQLMMTDKGYKAGTDTNGQVLFAQDRYSSTIVINLAGKNPQDTNKQFMSEIEGFVKQHLN